MSGPHPAGNPSRIEVKDVSVRFGGLQALDKVSLAIDGGEIIAVIGPNGAGKTTFVNCLSGLVEMESGEIFIGGQVTRAPLLPKLVDLGIGRTFQNIRLFPNLSVREHVELAHHCFINSRRGRTANRRQDGKAVADSLLARVNLSAKADLFPRELSYGERRRLEIVRALAIEPRLLLLDEPAAGMVPAEQVELAQLIRAIASDNIAIILIEHHMDLVASVASQVLVLNFGRLIVQGTITEVRSHPEVISAYLGSTAPSAIAQVAGSLQ